jgi:hypothetical protein
VRGLSPGEAPRAVAQGAREAEQAIRVSREGDVLTLRVGGGLFTSTGMHRLELHVPPASRLTLRTHLGKLSLERLAACDLNLHVSAGSVRLHDVRGRLRLSVDAGEVKGDGLGGTFSVQSQAGEVKLGITQLDAGEHVIRAAMGAVNVELAKGLDVRIESRTSLGSTRTRYPSNPSAAAVLRLEADLGSVRVREGGAAEDTRHGDWPDWRRVWKDLASSVARSLEETPPSPRPPSEELRKVLELVEAGKLSAADAERLLGAMR